MSIERKFDWDKAKTAFDTIDFARITICGSEKCPRKKDCLRFYGYDFLVRNNIIGVTCALFEPKGCTSFMEIRQEDIEGS